MTVDYRSGWQDGYDAGYAAGRKAAQEERGSVQPPSQSTSRPSGATATNWDYEGLGGYGSQER